MKRYMQVPLGPVVRLPLILLALLLGQIALADSVTVAFLKVDDSVDPPVGEFYDPNGMGTGKCKELAQGEFGCLRMEPGDKGPLNFIIPGSPGWKFEWIEIREPFANWGDLVPQFILNDFQDSYGASSSDFFDPNGRHVLSTTTKFFQFHNRHDSVFEVQYRVSVTNGTKSVIVHPIIENEG